MKGNYSEAAKEYMSYEAATRRCADVGLKICDRGTELTTCGLNEDDAQVRIAVV